MNLKKIKLSEIVNEKLAKEEIELLTGGNYTLGCNYRICSQNVNTATHLCTNGDAICGSGLD